LVPVPNEFLASVSGPEGDEMKTLLAGVLALGVLAPIAINIAVSKAGAAAAEDGQIVAGMDTQYQAAVKANDAVTMDRILADDFVLVTGSGKTHTKADLLAETRSGRMHYEHQEDTSQTVRVWGDTAVVTAKLWEKGTDSGKPFDYTLWFSDTYVRTPTGWRYVFGQASLPLPKNGG
jgi:ketosteroid isomerase-like protein